MTWGHEIQRYKLEAQRLRGLVEQKGCHDSLVTGDGHRHREFRSRHFGHRELAPGFRRLMAERLIPERLTAVAVTRHLK